MGDHEDIDHSGLTGVGDVAAHEADTTAVHGIADTSTLYKAGGTDVAVADGGTGSSTAAAARTALGAAAATDVTDHTGDATDAHDASAISFVPDGSIAATNVQAAIVEVRDEAASGSGIPATIVDVKGDSIWATAADTVARLPVGANGTVPLAASGETTGVKWATRELDYVEKTTATSVTATTEATADTVVTGSAITYDGATAILIEFYCNYFEAPASVNVRLFLYDGTSIGALAVVTPPASLFRTPIHVSRRLTPSAAEHTYSIRAQTDSGTASVNAGAGGSGNAMPAFIRITRAL